MRHARKDHQLTRFLRDNGFLADPRSFVSLPFVTPGAHSEGPHLFLYGIDKQRMHEFIVEHSKGWCEGCKPRHKIAREGEWDHIQNGDAQRCDCAANGRWVCAEFHRNRHAQPQWGNPQIIGEIEI